MFTLNKNIHSSKLPMIKMDGCEKWMNWEKYLNNLNSDNWNNESSVLESSDKVYHLVKRMGIAATEVFEVKYDQKHPKAPSSIIILHKKRIKLSKQLDKAYNPSTHLGIKTKYNQFQSHQN